MSGATAADEGAHAPTGDPFWQESWYFNFADPAAGVYGLTRIGYRPAHRRADGLFLALIAGRPAILYGPVGQRLDGPHVRIAPPGELRTRRLTFRCREPFADWSLIVANRNLQTDLTFRGFTPPYTYPPPAAGAAAAAASDHYEQGGRVMGNIRFRGRNFAIDGWGQRDHSWGPRHWAGVGEWVWISGQFPSGWCFNFWRVGRGDAATTCGFIGTGDGNSGIAGGSFVFGAGRRGHAPGADLDLHLAGGGRRRIRHTTAGCFSLYKDGAVIQEYFGTFACGGETGVGVVEHLYRGRLRALGLLGRAPRYLALALASR